MKKSLRQPVQENQNSAQGSHRPNDDRITGLSSSNSSQNTVYLPQQPEFMRLIYQDT
jgi:hypothetical protein